MCSSVIGKYLFFKFINRLFISWAIVPGSSLMNPTVLAIAYLIAMGYCFLGIAIISDIFMEAIENITAQTKTIELWDKESKSVSTNFNMLFDYIYRENKSFD